MATYNANTGSTMGGVGASAPIFNPQVLSDMLSGLQAFQANPTINSMQRGALDEMIGFQGNINQAFGEIGKGARTALNQQFGTQMKNLGANMQKRGLAGSSLAAVGQIDLEGARQSAIGDLENTLIDAQGNAISDLSGDFSGMLGSIGDQNAGVFASLLRLLMPQVSADDAVRAASQQASMPGGGGGGGGIKNDNSDVGKNKVGQHNWETGQKNKAQANADYQAWYDSMWGDSIYDSSGNRKTPSKKAEAASGGGASGGGGGGGGSGGGGGLGKGSSAPGAGSGFSGFGAGSGGILPVAPPPPPAPGDPGDDDEGEGDGEDEGPKYIFGWQKSGKSKFNPMNPVISAGS